MRARLAVLCAFGLFLAGCGSAEHPEDANSAYGSAATGPQRSAIERTSREFLAAEARGDWQRACALMAAEVKDQLPAKPGEGCAKALASLFKANPAQLQAAAKGISVSDVRLQGDGAYVFYSTPKNPSGYLPLRLQGASWRVATISGSSAPKERAISRN